MGERTVGEFGRHRACEGGSFILDARGTLLGFDHGMEALTGWPAVDVVGRAAGGRHVLAAEDGARLCREVRAIETSRPATSSVPLHMTIHCADGRVLEVEASGSRSPEAGERVTVTVLHVEAATVGRGDGAAGGPVDQLTGFAGRQTFHERLADGIRCAATAGRPLAVVLADVDRLRRIGDVFGRGAEDDVLRKLSGIVRATIRPEDFAARLGVDDFALMLPGFGRGSARQVAARLRSTVERFRFFGATEPAARARVTLSLGAATFPADADDADELLARAREALDEARALGRNRVWCYTRRPRVPLRTPVYLDGAEPLLLGYTKDLSPSGIFVATPAPIDIGMRCALSFPLPATDGHVHVIGRVVRTVPLQHAALGRDVQAPGMGIEFERFGAADRRAIDAFLYENEDMTLRPERGPFSVS